MEEKYSFLGKTVISEHGQGYRIRTMKLRKQLSQGLMLPMHMFGECLNGDVTDKLGVKLYEPKLRQGSVNSKRESVGVFPPFVHKTDEERLQNKLHYFETYKDEVWEATVKLDGSSMTVWSYDNAPHIHTVKRLWGWKSYLYFLWEKVKHQFIPPPTFGVCSRNINLREISGNAFWDMANQLDLRSVLAGHNVAIQGELIAPNIQDNYEKVKEKEFYVFNVFDIENSRYMLPYERDIWLDAHAPHLSRVPRISWSYKLPVGLDEMQEWVQQQKGLNIEHPEGVVFKSMGTRSLSFKLISNKYLLKEE